MTFGRHPPRAMATAARPFPRRPDPHPGPRRRRASPRSAGASSPACRTSFGRSRRAAWPIVSHGLALAVAQGRPARPAARNRLAARTGQCRRSRSSRRRRRSASAGKEAKGHDLEGEGPNHEVGFVSTRFAGTDGVGLETRQMGDDPRRIWGSSCSTWPGEVRIRPPSERRSSRRRISSTRGSSISPSACSAGPRVRPRRHARSSSCGTCSRPRLEEFVKTFGIGLLIVENALVPAAERPARPGPGRVDRRDRRADDRPSPRFHLGAHAAWRSMAPATTCGRPSHHSSRRCATSSSTPSPPVNWRCAPESAPSSSPTSWTSTRRLPARTRSACGSTLPSA